jgi:FKBP-type peptidyl-prolyl cis-trans isomerase FklB
MISVIFVIQPKNMIVKKMLFVFLLTPLCTGLLAQPTSKTPAGAPKPLLKSEIDSVSYAIGQNIGQNLKAQSLGNVNTAVLMRALNDALQGKKPLMNEQACGMAINQYMASQKSAKSKANAQAGAKFLAANKSKPGVVTLPSGLQYLVLKNSSDTVKPTLSSTVKCHYHGTLIDGTVFESSVERGEPATFQVSNVISGWQEALPMMTAGSKWRLFIPAALAYGDNQAGPKIGPGSTLIFDLELLEVQK